jgi:hypothetical protein
VNRPLARIDRRPSRVAESDLEETVRSLFRRLDGLAGFSVLDAASMAGSREAGRLEGDLCLADLTVVPPDVDAGAYFSEIALALIDVLDEHPEARELLRDRTFTRTLH